MAKTHQLGTKLWYHFMGEKTDGATQSLLARRLLREVSRYEGFETSAIDFALPGLELADQFLRELGLHLSIAHCPTMVVIGLSDQVFGIDCEAFGKSRNWDAMASSFFSEGEADRIASSKPNEKEGIFLRHWVLKEAYIKIIRGSVFGDLNAVILESFQKAKISANHLDSSWRAWTFCREGHIMAVCGLLSIEPQFYQVDLQPEDDQGMTIKAVAVDNLGLIEYT